MTRHPANDDSGVAPCRAVPPRDMASPDRDTNHIPLVSPDVATRHGATHAGIDDPGDATTVDNSGSGYATLACAAPARTAARLPARPLPVARLTDTTPAGTTHLVVTTMDVHGRLGDRTPLLALRWTAGQPIEFAVNAQAGVIVVRRGGPDAITSQGRLRVPPRIQRMLRLTAGDRMLVAAISQHDLLIAHTMAAVDAMVLAYHSAISQGEPS